MALAKWYKIDFHVHTPESSCFPDKGIDAHKWLTAAKESGMNGVVITDHNSIGFLEKRVGKIQKKSNLTHTKPAEFVSSNFFCNIALSINTHFSPINLLKTLKNIEKEMGRLRDSGDTRNYEDRVIDIDIVQFGSLNFYCKTLVIPHERHLYERDFSRALLRQINEH